MGEKGKLNCNALYNCNGDKTIDTNCTYVTVIYGLFETEIHIICLYVYNKTYLPYEIITSVFMK